MALQWSHRTDSPLRNRRLSAGQQTARGFTVQGTWVFRLNDWSREDLSILIARDRRGIPGRSFGKSRPRDTWIA